MFPRAREKQNEKPRVNQSRKRLVESAREGGRMKLTFVRSDFSRRNHHEVLAYEFPHILFLDRTQDLTQHFLDPTVRYFDILEIRKSNLPSCIVLARQVGRKDLREEERFEVGMSGRTD